MMRYCLRDRLKVAIFGKLIRSQGREYMKVAIMRELTVNKDSPIGGSLFTIFASFPFANHSMTKL